MSATDQDPGRPLQPHREPDEFDALLREAGWVRTLARRLARDQAAADDVAQGTLAWALERRPGTRGLLRPWLARVVVRLVRGHYYEGDREFTLVPLIDGRCEGHVPIGSASFLVVREMTGWGPAWERIRTVEIQ